MILNQDNALNNFYLPIDNSKFFVFSLNTSNQKFDFSKAFATYTFDFYLVFYKNDILTINEDLKQKLSSASSSRAVIWIDDLERTPSNEYQIMIIDWVKKRIEYQFIFGNDDSRAGTRIFIEGDSKVSVLFNSIINAIEFNLEKNNQIIENSGGTEIINEFKKFIIPLQHQISLLGYNSNATHNNIGYLCFRALKNVNQSIQPKTALITPNTQNKNALYSYKYFDDNSYSQGVEILALIYPCLPKNFNNFSKEFQSYLELFIMDNIKTNFIDEYGNNFTIPKHKPKESLVSRITFINPNEATPNKRGFFFTPRHRESLNLESSNGKYLLLGNSGTERQDKTKLEFHEYEEVLLTEKPNGGVENSKYADSITSIAISPKELTDSNKLNYYLDSEKAPLFDNDNEDENENTVHVLPENTGREVKYKSIETGTISKDTLIPIIPTLSFRDNPQLEELEKVLVKKRLNNIESSNSSKSVTPQGFLKSGTQLDYISQKPQKKKNRGVSLLDSENSNYRFTIKNVDIDFNISISKEDVFFVTTPSLLKAATFKDNFDIFFSIYDFDIDLILKNLTAPTDSERIIIFKYSRYTVEELLADTSKWSNYGKFRKTDWATINGNIKNEFASFEQKYNGGANKDYEYIVQSVYRDRNWNGVFILNIPIANGEDLPPIFTGLTASQKLQPNEQGNEKIALQTSLKFQYVAFPVNKTFINNNGLIEIKSTSYYGLIDYDIFEPNAEGKTPDYTTVHQYFKADASWQFVMSKLLVRFENSEIRDFKSYAFVKVPNLFEDKVQFDGIKLTHKDSWEKGDIENLFRLKGNYQKNSAGADEFIFDIEGNVEIKFTENIILRQITIVKAAFSYTNNQNNDFRFDLDGDVIFNKDFDSFKGLLSFESISFKNIGLKFPFVKFQLPKISFDVGKLLVLPKINFNGNGFLSSFPIKFNRFQVFNLLKGFKVLDFDFYSIIDKRGNCSDNEIPNDGINLWGIVFDFDLGTLGDLGLLKALKGELLLAWTKLGGFKLGFKLNGPSADGLHLDLFGAMKLDIEKVDLCSFDNAGAKTYFLRLIDARLTIFGKELPSKDDFDFNGIIYARPGDKIAWFIAATKIKNNEKKLLLGVGQRVGPEFKESDKKVSDVILRSKDVFDGKIDPCGNRTNPVTRFYKPDRNWLVASEDFIPEEWRNIFNLQFVFNDPALYGVYLDIVGLLQVDVLYKKLSENLGVYSAELQLDPSLRNQDFGGVAVTFPNLGVDIFTNGDFKVDIGYPKTSGDWSRSCIIQIRPFVGWAGFYFTKLRTASQSLFAQYERLLPQEGVNILQAGFAFRIGIGAYIDKGIFYVGASISVYGIMEGAFAFNKGQAGLQKFIPDHFALRGRVGAIAELVGYVDFKIIKASVYVMLRVEFGMLLVVIKGHGLQPVPLYIEGEVSVSIRVTIACFRIFRKRICIVIHLSFRTWVRFPYTLGGGDSNKLMTLNDTSKKLLAASPIKVNFGEVPLVYIPSVTKSNEGNYLIHQFAINFFGIKYDGDKLIFSENNILKDNIIKPIFSAILGTNSMNYSDLRYYFLGGENGSGDTVFDFTSFKPTLFVGYDDTDENFLKDIFGLKKDSTINEIEDFKNTIKDDPCSSNQKCPFRVIPIPVGSGIKVSRKNGAKFETDSDGFTIKLTGIFKDNSGNDIDIEKTFNRKNEYSTDDINIIEKHFDGYMTQFIERQNVHKFSLAAAPKDKDIREDAIIPEYFKLVGLLTLESYFNFLSSNESNREKPDFDPQIKLDDLFTENSGWKFNDHLEDIIGQLNYFYNNGLRLPDVLGHSNFTKAYYDLIKQTTSIQKINTNPTLANTDIIFSKHDGSIPISLKDDMLSGTGLKDFVDKTNEILSINIADLNNDITQISVDSPYQLINVKLSIPNSIINTEDTAYRFFEIPNKIHQNLNSEKVNLKVHTVSNSDVKNDEVLKYASCSNIEVSIKPHSIGGKIKSLELINVYIDDLNLMHELKANPDFIRNISIYLKEVKDEKITYKSLVKLGEEANTKLIKTNLSPRTHPPVIDAAITKMLALSFKSVKDKYVANLIEREDFVRLLWEGVTTSNGGFFLVESENSDLFSKISADSKDDIKIVFSFESAISTPFYAFNNFIKIQKDAIGGGRKVFDELDKSSHSLYAEVLLANGDNVKEYHAKIPVHCFGFTIERKELKSAYEHYVPIEFGIKGSSGIDKNNILPLMPQQKKDDTGLTIPNKLFYSHITPINKVNSLENPNRYENVGKNIQVEFGVRDTYGFRALALDKELDYKHIYFDKLIPLNAWPFISVSYWFKEYKNNELKFELKIKAFEKKAKGEYDNERIIESLNTIIAQLLDKNVAVEFDKNFIHSQDDLKQKLLSSLYFVKTNLNIPNPKENELKVEFKLKVNSELKNRLNPIITISRKVSDDLFVNVNDSNVWEYGTIKSISTEINIPEDSTIKSLNDAINKSPYVLGISSDDQKQKVIYLLNKDFLQLETKESTPLERSSYFAIKPYSNKLWSGAYQSHKKNTTGNFIKGEKQDFTSIDLDKGLSIILSKIDDLLTPSNIKNFNVDYVEELVMCKKLIVESELKYKTGNIDTPNDNNQDELRKELRDLLLESLDKFYQYDGIVRLSPTNPNLDKLKDHRLSISVAKQNDYTIQSSKIDFRADNPKWFILFDQIGLSRYVEFDIIPKLTHIEFEISSEISSPEIEKSIWIQLVEPIDLLASGKSISTKNKKWPRIFREFPDKPQIINHTAEQKISDEVNALSWSYKLGEWQYKISIQDQYRDVDELKIFIKTVSLEQYKLFSESEVRNFKGFIAFWASIFTDKTQKMKLEDFIDDLGYQLSLSPLLSADNTRALSNNANSFTLRKGSGNWSIENHTPYTISQQVDKGNLNIVVGGKGFNLFEIGERIKSITSEITAYRNRDAQNDEFVYVTETVSPSSWATPHIRFFTPIKIDDSVVMQDVFNKMKEINLPYKASAKLLINTADIETDRKAKLPVIPISQMEFKECVLPSVNPFDNVFKNYTNGYPSILVTIYNKSDESEDENDLPIFFANNIYKPKQ